MSVVEDRAAVEVTHPVWCVNYPEDDGRIKGECEYEHRGDPYRLDAGPSAAFQVSATVVEGFEVFEGDVVDHGARVELTVWNREDTSAPASAHLEPREVERLRQLLELAARDSRLGARVAQR